MKGILKKFAKDNSGIGVVEIVLILVEIYTCERDVYCVLHVT